MADKDDILTSLLTQSPYIVTDVDTDDFIEKLHRDNSSPQKIGAKLNDAVKQNLRFGVTIPSNLEKDNVKE